MRKSMKFLMALMMVVSPEVVGAMPMGNIPTIQMAPAGPLVHKVEVIRRHGTTVRRGPAGNTVVHHGSTTVARRPYYRPWVRRPYYGTVVAGVALGTVVAATAVAVAPRPPSPSLCWYWSNSSQTRGYWDYCR
ncbi:hypothetical protein DTW90_09300 [Neorhizobium sp. P12A]|nr:hypothetical protein DTW90_09300 [Neorhizobium sp. P12A]